MKHKSFIVMLISVVLLMAVVSSVIAEEYLPYSSGANSVSLEFKLSDGVATAIANTTALASGTTPKTTVYIQKKESGKWVEVASASGGSEAYVSYTVESGKIYRGYAVGKIYNSAGEKVDELSIYSNPKP